MTYIALLWFDYALTLPAEVHGIWNRGITGATALYLITRYAALTERVMLVAMVGLWSISDEVRPIPAVHSYPPSDARLPRLVMSSEIPTPRVLFSSICHSQVSTRCRGRKYALT